MAEIEKDVSFTNDKEQSRFSKITKVVVWLMLVVTIGSTALTAILSL